MAVEHFLPSAIAHFEPADLIGALTTGIVMLDSDLCVVYANVAAQDLMAVSVNQARGRPFLSLVLDAESLNALMRRAVETGETLSERELSVHAGPLGREHRVIDVTMTPLDSEFDRKYLLLEIADATQRQRIARCRHLLGQASLPHARLAGQQHQGASPRERFADRLVEPRELGLTSDERATPHGASLRRAVGRLHRQDHLLRTAGRRTTTPARRQVIPGVHDTPSEPAGLAVRPRASRP